MLLNFLKNDKAKKSFTLFMTMVISVFVGIAVSILNTRFLGKEQYGDFKFILNIYAFIITFLTFGLFYTSGRIIAQINDKRNQRKVFGETITISFGISLVFMLIILVFSFIQPKLYSFNVGKELRIFLPLLMVFPVQLCLEQLLQGNNKIYSLSVFRITPKLLYIILFSVAVLIFSINTEIALLLHLVSFIIVIFIILIIQKPILSFKLKNLSKIVRENRTYGFQIYLGAITGVASHYIAGISIGYFVDNIDVGFYSLAITATLPLSMLPVSVGTTYFKQFVTMDKIPKKLILYTLIIGISALIVFIIFIKKIVILLYPAEFLPVVNLSYYLAIGSVMHGFADFINRFLSAKGLGKSLRNSNFIVGFINLIGYTMFVALFNTHGAVMTRIVAGSAYLIVMIYYYKQYLKKFLYDE